tara:strand:+ start:2501 stop:4153 length:1653 start_codon:yes stop_codon:yes gene_type:complete
MANKKFSEFDLKTNSSDVAFVVGFNGSDNVRITPANLAPAAPVTSVNSLTGAVSLGLTQLDDVGSDGTNGQVLTTNGSGSFTFTTASGGATSLNGLSDVLVDTDSLYVGEVPSNLSGNPQDNTILGIRAGESLTSGDSNTLIGNNAGDSITSGTNSVAIGLDALSTLSTGGSNVAIGKNAYRTGTASNNVYIGLDAGTSANTGIYQVGIGVSAGNSNTGSNSIGIGNFANRNNSAEGTISIGHQSGFSNTSGASNTNIGFKAGYSYTTGGSNTNIGYEAGKSITGSSNTFVGTGAASAGSGSGFDNTSLGQNSLFALTNGSQNTVIGRKAALNLTTGVNNVLVGYEAGKIATDAGSNTAVGYQAGIGLSSGTGNVMLGFNAGQSIGSGTNNTCLGSSTDPTVTGTNTTAIGYAATSSPTNGSNQVTLGNSSIATLRCAVTSITAISDERDKTQIETIPYGLDFIDSLQPKKFVWDNRAETDLNGNEFFSSRKGQKDIGFIAQDLQGVDDDYLNLVYDGNPDKLEATYGRLIPVLVQAIKELKSEVELLKS